MKTNKRITLSMGLSLAYACFYCGYILSTGTKHVMTFESLADTLIILVFGFAVGAIYGFFSDMRFIYIFMGLSFFCLIFYFGYTIHHHPLITNGFDLFFLILVGIILGVVTNSGE